MAGIWRASLFVCLIGDISLLDRPSRVKLHIMDGFYKVGAGMSGHGNAYLSRSA